jgi:hypothetical protein
MATRQIKRNASGVNALAPQVRKRIDLDEDYSDVSGDPGSEFSLDNEDPSRHYVFAHNSPEDIGAFQRDVCGYQAEVLEPGGVCPKGSKDLIKVGETIAVRDHVLMSCDKAKWEKRQRYLNNHTAIENARRTRELQADTNLEADRFAGQKQRTTLSHGLTT